jgi:hypothetical protein
VAIDANGKFPFACGGASARYGGASAAVEVAHGAQDQVEEALGLQPDLGLPGFRDPGNLEHLGPRLDQQGGQDARLMPGDDQVAAEVEAGRAV